MGRLKRYRPTASAVVSSIMNKVASAATRVSIRSQPSSHLCMGLGVVPLDGLPQIAEELAAWQPLGLHALQPLLLDRLELGQPALALLGRQSVDGSTGLLDRLDADEFVLVPNFAVELGPPVAGEIVDDLTKVGGEAVVLLPVHE